MFQLTKEESEILRFQIGTLGWGTYSKYLPYAFTEHGVLMLSSVLKSERAIHVNIQIMRAFVKIRQLLSAQNETIRKVEEINKRTAVNSEKIRKHDSRLHFLDVVVETLAKDVNKLNKLLPYTETNKDIKIGFYDRKKRRE